MPGRQAKIISPAMLRKMLARVRRSRTSARDRVIILLSIKAGLRAAEIAKLDWSMVLEPQGRVGHLIVVQDAIAKMGSGRRIPMHPHLRRALLVLWRSCDAKRPRHSFRPRGRHASEQHCELVRRTVRRTWVRGMLLAFRAPHLHHYRGPQSSSRRLQPARRAAPRRALLDRPDAALHRGFLARAATSGRHGLARRRAIIAPSRPAATGRAPLDQGFAN